MSRPQPSVPTADQLPFEADAAAPVRSSPGMVTHYMRYSIANVMVILAGFISFPLLTRLLDNTQYGILGYFTTWMMIAISAAKLGAQHSVVRFYPYGADAQASAKFGTNFVLLPIALSITLWALVVAGLVGARWLGGGEHAPVFWCVVFITPLAAISSIIQMVVRASEQSGRMMATKIIGRWLELALVVSAVVLIERSALSVYGGRLVASALMLVYFIYWASTSLRFSFSAIDLREFRTAMLYGLPLMANEFSGMALVAIDRVMLKHMTGDFAIVGIYTIGYSLAMQINLFMNATLAEAFIPVANRIHGKEGDDGVRALKARILLPLTYVSVAIATLLTVSGEDALVALSGTDKAASGQVFVLVGTMLALYPLFDISAYGLLLRKRSVRVFMITLTAALLNVAVNLVMIPRFGFMGAAWATVISYGALCALNALSCPRELLRFPDARTVATAMGAATLLVAVAKGTSMLGVDGTWARLFVGGGMFLVLYVLPVWLLDPRIREASSQWLATMQAGREGR